MATTRHSRPHGDTRRFRSRLAVSALAAVVAALGVLPAQASQAPVGTVLGSGSPTAVKGSYIVTLEDDAPRASRSAGRALVAAYGGTVKRTYTHALHGYSATLSPAKARQLAADPAVDKVYQDQRFTLSATQTDPPSWGLDRVDQRRLPLDRRYTHPEHAGAGSTVYVIDTGVLTTHQDLAGRARHGYDAVDQDGDATDGNGHGTHVATTAAGTSFGVAKRATVVGVRVLNDQGSGTTEQVLAGIDWVQRDATGPSVVNMSLGGNVDEALDQAVRNAIADGLTFTVAAGNAGRDVDRSSPARVTEAITVGATDRRDARAPYSNLGAGLDLFAPGSDITAGWHTSNNARKTLSGTSMAAPHVAGVAALYLASHAQATPYEVGAALTAGATPQVVGTPGLSSPNRLLHIVG